MPLAIEVNHLTKTFQNPAPFLSSRKPSRVTKALNAVNLSINDGEIFVLLGPNGSGKTTLIKILCTLMLPDSGRVTIAGFDLIQQARSVRPLVSLVFGDEQSFYWRLTGRQNLEFFAALYGLSKKQAKKKINEAEKVLQLPDLDKGYQTYSTGMRQHLALARIFFHDAKIIFMDEPTRSLDPNARARLRDLIQTLRRTQNRTFFLSTHDTLEAGELADRIAILDQGEIKAVGDLKSLRQQTELSPSATLEEIFRKRTLSLEESHVG